MCDPYPKEITDLQTVDGFMKMFYKCLKDQSNMDAYEQTEQFYEKYFRKRRFSDYTTFKVIKSRYLNRK